MVELVEVGAAVAAVVAAGVELVVVVAVGVEPVAVAAVVVAVGAPHVVAASAAPAKTGIVRRRLSGPPVEVVAAGEVAVPGSVAEHSEAEGCTTTTLARYPILLLAFGGLPTGCYPAHFVGPRNRSAGGPEEKPPRLYMPPM